MQLGCSPLLQDAVDELLGVLAAARLGHLPLVPQQVRGGFELPRGREHSSSESQARTPHPVPPLSRRCCPLGSAGRGARSALGGWCRGFLCLCPSREGSRPEAPRDAGAAGRAAAECSQDVSPTRKPEAVRVPCSAEGAVAPVRSPQPNPWPRAQINDCRTPRHHHQRSAHANAASRTRGPAG